MLTSLLLAAAIWPASVTHNCEPIADSIVVGVAQTLSGEHLYCELLSQSTETSLDISYVLKNHVFAEKKISYGKNPAIPSIIQKDFRFGEIRKAEVSDNNIVLYYQPNQQKKMLSKAIPIHKVDIVDAGFDNFIRNHWEELEAGKTLSVSFASMAHLKALPLRITKQPFEKCTIKSEKDAKLFCFLVDIDNPLLRLVLGNIKVTYDQQHRLYEFNGVVNILDYEQDNQKAIIRYFYKDDYLSSEK